MIAVFIVGLRYFFGSSKAETPQAGIDRRQIPPPSGFTAGLPNSFGQGRYLYGALRWIKASASALPFDARPKHPPSASRGLGMR
jgi:hypothetical protein